MGPKLLFVLGIVLAHGALGAAWVRQEAPQGRTAIASCVNMPGAQPGADALPDFTPKRVLVAVAIIPRSDHSEVMQP